MCGSEINQNENENEKKINKMEKLLPPSILNQTFKVQ